MNTSSKRIRTAAARKASRGMTLIEILVVLAIIGLIIGGVTVVASNAFSGAQEDTAKNEVLAIEQQVEMYKVQKKKCPKSMQDLKAAGITKKVKKDPWGTPYDIKCPGEESPIEVRSAGPDKELGSDDDIKSWEGDADEESEE